MKWTVRFLLVGMACVGGVGCAAAPAPRPVTAAYRGAEARTLPAGPPAPACPPGTLSDGARCRRQRGIVIDQRHVPARDQGGGNSGDASEPCPGGIVIDQRCTSSPPPSEPPPVTWLDVLRSLFGDG